MESLFAAPKTELPGAFVKERAIWDELTLSATINLAAIRLSLYIARGAVQWMRGKRSWVGAAKADIFHFSVRAEGKGYIIHQKYMGRDPYWGKIYRKVDGLLTWRDARAAFYPLVGTWLTYQNHSIRILRTAIQLCAYIFGTGVFFSCLFDKKMCTYVDVYWWKKAQYWMHCHSIM